MMPPKGIERDYARWILRRIEDIQFEIYKALISKIPALNAEANPEASRGDDWIDDIDSIMAGLRVGSGTIISGAEQKAFDFGNNASAFNREQFNRLSKTVLGVDIIARDPKLGTTLKAFAKENAGLIKNISETMINDVEAVVRRGLRSGAASRMIEGEIVNRFEVSERRARLIARDQIAKLNSDITEQRQKELGIDEYYWQTSQDERVRGDPGGKYPNADPSHYAMNGMICRWDDPSLYREPGSQEWKPRSGIGGPDEHPGKPINCRCIALPNLEGLIDES